MNTATKHIMTASEREARLTAMITEDQRWQDAKIALAEADRWMARWVTAHPNAVDPLPQDDLDEYDRLIAKSEAALAELKKTELELRAEYTAKYPRFYDYTCPDPFADDTVARDLAAWKLRAMDTSWLDGLHGDVLETAYSGTMVEVLDPCEIDLRAIVDIIFDSLQEVGSR